MVLAREFFLYLSRSLSFPPDSTGRSPSTFLPFLLSPCLDPCPLPPSRRRSAARPDWPVHVCTIAAITISSRAFLSARSYVRSEMNWVIVKSCPAGCNCPRVPRHVRTRPQATSSIFHSGSPFASVDIERAYQVEKSPHSSPSEPRYLRLKWICNMNRYE